MSAAQIIPFPQQHIPEFTFTERVVLGMTEPPTAEERRGELAEELFPQASTAINWCDFRVGADRLCILDFGTLPYFEAIEQYGYARVARWHYEQAMMAASAEDMFRNIGMAVLCEEKSHE